jgi:hypothetical protein
MERMSHAGGTSAKETAMRARVRDSGRVGGIGGILTVDMKLLLPLFLAFPLLAQETILLPLHDKGDPAAPAEQIQERGKDGVIDRSISNVRQPTVTVYLPAKEKRMEPES